MFVGGIGSHLKVSQVDQSVCLGNELNNLSARKDFLLKNIKSSHPSVCVCNEELFWQAGIFFGEGRGLEMKLCKLDKLTTLGFQGREEYKGKTLYVPFCNHTL